MCFSIWYVNKLCEIKTELTSSDIDEIVRSVEDSTEFFTGKVCCGYDEEKKEPKYGNHPVTYDQEGNILIKILAKPNASKTIIGVTTKVERLGLRIAAPPVDGKANAEMLRFLAKVLDVKKSALSIIEDNGDFKTVKVAAGTMFIEDLLKKLLDAQYMKPAHIGHPDYLKFYYVDEEA
ncbi:UPF0235 protein C15orf40 homolog [Macrosteles quadrilineatus]|uniref:UPF0235 protein C15orf40 homolog n=1 Tax=Macrosteles quadrilineatus TaxID=74068 RepID=UPI0023E26B3B|nr:UPF0235 protein C15orf40 homolog [Macrosteles quadrilineatus]